MQSVKRYIPPEWTEGTFPSSFGNFHTHLKLHMRGTVRPSVEGFDQGEGGEEGSNKVIKKNVACRKMGSFGYVIETGGLITTEIRVFGVVGF